MNKPLLNIVILSRRRDDRISRKFREGGLSVSMRSDVRWAVDVIRKSKVDAVILDLQGWEQDFLHGHIFRLRAEASPLPLIAINYSLDQLDNFDLITHVIRWGVATAIDDETDFVQEVISFIHAHRQGSPSDVSSALNGLDEADSSANHS